MLTHHAAPHNNVGRETDSVHQEGHSVERDVAVSQHDGHPLSTRPGDGQNTRHADTTSPSSTNRAATIPSLNIHSSMPGSLPPHLQRLADPTSSSQTASSSRPALSDSSRSQAVQISTTRRQHRSTSPTLLPVSEVSVPVRGPYRYRSASGNARSTAPPHKVRLDDKIPVLHENGHSVCQESTRTRVPVRGILKIKPPPIPKFNFRRDIFNYVGESIAAAASSIPSPTIVAPSADSGNHGDARSSPASSPKAVEGSATASIPSRGGALWKKIGGAVSAVAAQVPVTQSAARSISNFAEKQAAAMDHASVALESRDNYKRAASPSSVHRHDEWTDTQPSASKQSLRNDHLIATASLLRSVRFNMATLSVVYPINVPQPPGTEASTRRKINKEQHAKARQRRGEGWSAAELLRVYNDSCRVREEHGIDALRQQLQTCVQTPKTIDLSGKQLSRGAVEVLSDLLAIDFGLRKLVLDGCGLDDASIKPLLHALLVSGSLPTLSLAENKRIHARGWRMVCSFVSRAKSLKYLDISDNSIDKKVTEELILALSSSRLSSDSASTDISASASLTRQTSSNCASGSCTDSEDELPPCLTAPLLQIRQQPVQTSSLSSLRMENCSLKNSTLEVLAHGIRYSNVKHVSLRKNRINHMGAVALALLIRDYELPAGGISILADTRNESHIGNAYTSASATGSHAPAPSVMIGNSVTARLQAIASGEPRSAHNPSVDTSLRAHTPARSLTAVSCVSATASASPDGLTTDGDDSDNMIGPDRNRGRVLQLTQRDVQRHADLKQRLRQQIDALPQVGNLLTLDVRSNDLRTGISYLAQVLKRNRTLRVLNLSDNKIDGHHLATLAEALKYNITLETLDLSHNPCCGPGIEGVTTLRTAFAYNTSLKRIFLNATDLTSTGAIALAEILPEVKTILHIDLTDNPAVDIAAVMALSAALKLNASLRCLDLSIPPNEPEFARLSQDILQSCVRNTEAAQQKSAAQGTKGLVAQPIYKSGLARNLKDIEHGTLPPDVAERALTTLPEAWHREVQSAQECIGTLMSHLEMDDELRRLGQPLEIASLALECMQRTRIVQLALTQLLGTLYPGEQKDAVGARSSQLAILYQRAETRYGYRPQQTPVRNGRNSSLLSPVIDTTPIGSPASPSAQLPSPSFSITDSDDDDSTTDDEEGGHDDQQTPIKSQPGLRPVKRKDVPKGLRIITSPVDVDNLANSLSQNVANPRSPADRHSRSLTLEEGEVFRKSSSKVADDDERTLLDLLDDEGAGDQLKQEILDTEVKPRRRRTSVGSLEEPPEQHQEHAAERA